MGANCASMRMIFPLENAVLPVMKILPTFTFAPSVDVESELHRVGAGDSFERRLYDRELAAVLGQQFLQDHFGFFNARGIELALDRQSDFAVLEPVQNVRFGNRFVALVFDAPDDGPLGEVENDDFVSWACPGCPEFPAGCPRNIACSTARGNRGATHLRSAYRRRGKRCGHEASRCGFCDCPEIQCARWWRRPAELPRPPVAWADESGNARSRKLQASAQDREQAHQRAREPDSKDKNTFLRPLKQIKAASPETRLYAPPAGLR